MPVTQKNTENATATLASRHGGCTLLLAEDNPVNREVALDILHAAGLHVVAAVDGRAAIEAARRQACDLILMDMQMPELDGIGATRALRVLPEYAETPIIAMTANAFEEDRQACLNAGMNDFVTKPVDPDLLYLVLLKWLPEKPRKVGAGETAPAAVDEKAWRQLTAIDGLDPARGLAIARNRFPFYLRLVGLFIAAHGDDARQLRAMIAADDRAGIHRIAHALKGATGNIGATRVSLGATSVLAADQLNGQDFAERVRSLAVMLDQLVNDIYNAIRLK